jgi:phenylalanyl-tRNA synthetase beta chain
MRPTLLASLLDAARYNVSRDVDDVRIFESGTVYRAADVLADEHHALGVLLTGSAAPASWRGGPRQQADFFAAKALLDAVLGVAGVEFSLERADRPFLHRGRSAAVLATEQRLGFIGELHPAVAASWELGATAVWAIDLGLVAGAGAATTTYKAFGSFPAMREDLAVVVADGVAAGDVIATVRAAGGPDLETVELFDVYSGEQVGEGRVSLALHLEFRSDDRTLTDDEVSAQRAAIGSALAERHGGELRA